MRLDRVCPRWAKLLPSACARRRTLVLIFDGARLDYLNQMFHIPFNDTHEVSFDGHEPYFNLPVAERDASLTLSNLIPNSSLGGRTAEAAFTEMARFYNAHFTDQLVAYLTDLFPNVNNLVVIHTGCDEKNLRSLVELLGFWPIKIVKLWLYNKVNFIEIDGEYVELPDQHPVRNLLQSIKQQALLQKLSLDLRGDGYYSFTFPLELYSFIGHLKVAKLYLGYDDRRNWIWPIVHQLDSTVLRNIGLGNFNNPLIDVALNPIVEFTTKVSQLYWKWTFQTVEQFGAFCTRFTSLTMLEMQWTRNITFTHLVTNLATLGQLTYLKLEFNLREHPENPFVLVDRVDNGEEVQRISLPQIKILELRCKKRSHSCFEPLSPLIFPAVEVIILADFSPRKCTTCQLDMSRKLEYELANRCHRLFIFSLINKFANLERLYAKPCPGDSFVDWSTYVLQHVKFVQLKTKKPVTFTWVIDNFKRDWQKNRESPKIKLSSTNLCMRLGPGTGDDVQISFKSKPYNPWLNYRISLINDKGRKCLTQEGSVESSKYKIFLDYDYLDGFLQDGKVTIYAEFYEFSTVECTQNRFNNLVSPSQPNQSLLDSGKWSDVVLVAGGREFKAHKSILSACSVAFEKMFEHELDESKSNRVEITDMTAGVCESLLQFIYTGKVSAFDRLEFEHAYELIAVAVKYQIDSLKSHCELCLTVSLSESTVYHTFQLAHQYSVEELKSKCIDYIGAHSAQFKFDHWNELTTHHLESMFRVFQLSETKRKNSRHETQEESANRPNNLRSLSQDNESLLKSGELSDVILAVGDRELKAHKLILSTRSVVFKNMFNSGLEESIRNRVEIADMSAGACEDMLKFIYTDKVSWKALLNHGYELFAAAYKYQIVTLKWECESYLADWLSFSTVPETLQLAHLYSAEELKSKCIDYISSHSEEFKFEDWKELTTRFPESMFRVFQFYGDVKLE